jgi:hypothetical protein
LQSKIELEKVEVLFNLDQGQETSPTLTFPSEVSNISKGKNTIFIRQKLPGKQRFFVDFGFLRIENVWLKFSKQSDKKFEITTKQIDYRPPIQFETRAFSPFHGEHDDSFVTGVQNHLEISTSLFSENSHIDEILFEFPASNFSWIGPIECKIYKHGCSKYDNPEPIQVTTIQPGENLTFELKNPIREDYVMRMPVVPTHLFAFPLSEDDLVSCQVKCKMVYHLSINNKASLLGKTLMIIEKKFLPPVLPALTVKHLPGCRLFNLKIQNYLFKKDLIIKAIDLKETADCPLAGLAEEEKKIQRSEEIALFWKKPLEVKDNLSRNASPLSEKITFEFDQDECPGSSSKETRASRRETCLFNFNSSSITSALVLDVQTKIQKFLIKNEITDATYELELLDKSHESANFCFRLGADPKKFKIIGATQKKFVFSKQDKISFLVRLLPLVSGLLEVPEPEFYKNEGKKEVLLDKSQVMLHGKKQIRCYAPGKIDLRSLKTEQSGLAK